MVPVAADLLVLIGTAILVLSLNPVGRLMALLPEDAVRSRWDVLRALIAVFILGYVAYAVAFRDHHRSLVDLIVPAIFFFGSCFVWIAVRLSLRTAIDVVRLASVERENVTDALTDVFNRRYLDRHLRGEVIRARRYGFPLSVIFLDVDKFKQINDEWGHKVGDQVLLAVVEVVARELRATDVLTRYGGDEFVIIAPHTTIAKAIELAERLIRSVEASNFSFPGLLKRIWVRCSAGVAGLDEDRNSAEAILEAADAGLYRAKSEGRNRVFATQDSRRAAVNSDAIGRPADQLLRRF